ncbi:monocarboxylate transporter 12-like [Brachionus plicatilis]|uniref:Monocarboxylate transporter 12-like n=1 Tax=Brachionus plicatilis TaxID=10195 RepID=A0A3M7R028_BRAPC|nr:monocarboxylate transporter 12-like [Brachionus plicatilis]
MARKSLKEERVPAPPDGGYGWVVLVATFFIAFMVAGCMYSIGIILPDIKDHFKETQEKINLLSSLNTGFFFCSGPIVAGLANQLGIRPVVMGGAIVTALCYVASAYSSSVYLVMVLYGVIGGLKFKLILKFQTT